MDDISRFYKCPHCFCLDRDCTEEEYYKLIKETETPKGVKEGGQIDVVYFNAILKETYAREKREEIEWEREREKQLADNKRGVKNSDICLKSARLENYKSWLAEFLKRGGKPTHAYNYEMPLDNWFVAIEDLEVIPLYGSKSVNIIISKNIKFKGGDLGHSNLYFMENGKNIGGFIPIYTDSYF